MIGWSINGFVKSRVQYSRPSFSTREFITMQQKCFRSFCITRDDYARFVIILHRSVTIRAAPICNNDESDSSNSFQSWLVGMCIFQFLPVKIWSRGQTLVGDSVAEKHLHLIFLKAVDQRHPKSSEITVDQTRPPKVKLYKWDFRQS